MNVVHFTYFLTVFHVSFRSSFVKAEVAWDGKGLLLDVGLLFDLRRTLRLALDPLGTRRIRACGFALRALVFQLAVRAAVAVSAVLFQLAMRAGDAHHAVLFQLAARAAFALRAASFHLTMGGKVAHHAATFLPPVRASLYSHRSCPTNTARHDLRCGVRESGVVAFPTSRKRQTKSFRADFRRIRAIVFHQIARVSDSSPSQHTSQCLHLA